MAQTSIILKNISVNQQENFLLNDVSFALDEGSHLLVTGISGSGKTTLAKAITSKIFYKGFVEYGMQQPKIILVDQHYNFKTLSNTNDFYYQQRYNSFDSNDALTVNEELLKILDDTNKIDGLLNQLNLIHRKHDSLLHLSSGEHKRFQLIKAFLQDANVYIFDSPYIGLDVNSRKNLNEIINKKSESSTIIIIADVEDVPSCITHVAELENGKLKSFETKDEYVIARNEAIFSREIKHSIFNNQHSTEERTKEKRKIFRNPY